MRNRWARRKANDCGMWTEAGLRRIDLFTDRRSLITDLPMVRGDRVTRRMEGVRGAETGERRAPADVICEGFG
jgi:hypothetical protein